MLLADFLKTCVFKRLFKLSDVDFRHTFEQVVIACPRVKSHLRMRSQLLQIPLSDRLTVFSYVQRFLWQAAKVEIRQATSGL